METVEQLDIYLVKLEKTLKRLEKKSRSLEDEATELFDGYNNGIDNSVRLDKIEKELHVNGRKIDDVKSAINWVVTKLRVVRGLNIAGILIGDPGL